MTKLFFMTQPRSEPFGFVTINHFLLRKCSYLYIVLFTVCHFTQFLRYFTVFWGQGTIIWHQLLTIFLRNNYQFSVYRTFVLSGRCPVLETTVSDQKKKKKVFNRGKETKWTTTTQAILWWCLHRPNKCSIRGLISSRNHSVTSAGGNSLPTEWWVTRPRFRKQRKKWQT